QLHSNSYKKQTNNIAKLHEKISNKRIDNLHKISLQIIRENQFIFSEDLNIKGMVKNPNLSKAIHDCGWHELIRQLTYKGLWNDRIYPKVDRYFASSQLCSHCGYKNEEVKDLTLREWDCPICKVHHNRDINASKNILMQGLKDLNIGL
ncbi:RNA-guided endonuclease TnpB family protein, partial [Clostridium sp. Marseille-Q7071]